MKRQAQRRLTPREAAAIAVLRRESRRIEEVIKVLERLSKRAQEGRTRGDSGRK